MTLMEREILAVLREESNASIIGVQIKALGKGRRRLDIEVILEVFVETESPEDAKSLVHETQALSPDFIINSVNSEIADEELEGVYNTGVSEPEVSIQVSGMKLTAEFDLDQRYEDPDSVEFQGLMREMESEILAVLRDESSVTMNIIGVQIKAIDSEGTLEVFVETENSEDAG